MRKASCSVFRQHGKYMAFGPLSSEDIYCTVDLGIDFYMQFDTCDALAKADTSHNSFSATLERTRFLCYCLSFQFVYFIVLKLVKRCSISSIRTNKLFNTHCFGHRHKFFSAAFWFISSPWVLGRFNEEEQGLSARSPVPQNKIKKKIAIKETKTFNNHDL